MTGGAYTQPSLLKPRRINYKALYLKQLDDNRNLITEFKENAIRKSTAKLVFKREKIKSEYFRENSERVNNKLIIVKELISALKKYIQTTKDAHCVQLSNVAISVDILKEYIESADNAVTEIVTNCLKREVLDFAATVMSKKIQRLEIDQPFLLYEREDYFEGAYHVIRSLLEMRDAIEPDQSNPYEDTLEYELQRIVQDLHSEVAI